MIAEAVKILEELSERLSRIETEMNDLSNEFYTLRREFKDHTKSTHIQRKGGD